MCTLLLAYRAHPRYRLVIAANRDEYYQRPTAPAGFWDDAGQVFAGRDLVHGGSWLGVTTTGRIAALTNYREPKGPGGHGPSRGELVSGFLRQEGSAERYLEELAPRGACYSGFNLLLGDSERMFCYSNRGGEAAGITPGIHGLSNHLLDTPWPKVVRGKEALARLLAADDFAVEDLFAILADRTRAPDEELPDTGVGLETERLLSSIFIESEHYGTRSSSVLTVDREGKALFIERSFEGGNCRDREIRLEWS